MKCYSSVKNNDKKLEDKWKELKNKTKQKQQEQQQKTLVR